jgi:predicted RNA binding protein YcfA (HicA-like mRNA interferase family)
LSKLPVVSGREVVKALEKVGYAFDHQRGSHMVIRLTQPPHRRLTVPDHREVAKGTLRAIIRESGLSVDEFTALLQ